MNASPEEDGNEIEITARDHNDTAVMDKGSKTETLSSKSDSDSKKSAAGCQTSETDLTPLLRQQQSCSLSE